MFSSKRNNYIHRLNTRGIPIKSNIKHINWCYETEPSVQDTAL